MGTQYFLTLIQSFPSNSFLSERKEICLWLFAFTLLIFLVQKISWWSDSEVSATPLCGTFSSQLVIMWSIRVEVWHVILVGCFMRCFSRTSLRILFTNSTKIRFSFSHVFNLSNMFSLLLRMFILVSPRIKRSRDHWLDKINESLR